MLSPAEIQRALRLITSPEFKRANHFPITVLAHMCGLHRSSIYNARDGRHLTQRLAETLSPVLEDILAGKLQAQRHNGYQVKAINEQRVEQGGMLERLFPPRGRTG